MLRIFATLAIFCTLSLAAIAAAGWFYLDRWSDQAVLVTDPVNHELKRGTSLRRLAHELEAEGVVTNASLFRLWVRTQRDFTRFQAGLYLYKDAVSPREIVAAMQRGDVHTPIVAQFTIPEGFRMVQIAARLEANGIGTKQEALALMNDVAFLRANGIEDAKTAEGFLYPATYHYIRVPSTTEVLSQMIATFFASIPRDYESRVNGMGLTLYQAVNFASLIELETKHDDERDRVSEVIWRRLRNREPTGIDAAIIYGIKDYDGNIRFRHLRDATNPYNTRIHRGLPPTPIGSPARASLLAVLSPTDYGYNYYVLDATRDDGRHHFSKTLQEHNRYVQKLVRAAREARQGN